MKNAFEPVTDTMKNTSEILTKTITETFFNNNKALEKFNNALLEKMNDRGIMAPYLLSPLCKITILESSTQFNFLKRPSSKIVND